MTFIVRQLTDATDEEINKLSYALAEAFEKRFFPDVLDNSEEYMFESIRAHVNGGIIDGEVYVVETQDKGIVGGTVWFGPGKEFMTKSVSI